MVVLVAATGGETGADATALREEAVEEVEAEAEVVVGEGV